MTQSEWEACQDPQKMLVFLRNTGKTSKRRCRLFICACVRRILHLVPDKKTVESWEGQDDEAAEYSGATPNTDEVAEETVHYAANHAAINIQGSPRIRLITFNVTKTSEQTAQAALLRDIFCLLPFHEVPIDPAWLTGPIRGLAEAAYQERELPAGTLDPTRLLVLADALEEAGAGEIVAHLRGPGTHVRGCWCLDLLTGRE